MSTRGEPRVVLAVRVARAGIDAMDQIAAANKAAGIKPDTRSACIRQAFSEYVARHRPESDRARPPGRPS